MFVKKFEAQTLEEGLRVVKRELGPGALILSTQKKKAGLLGKPSVEITAAFEPKDRKAAAPDLKELAKVFPHRRDKEYGDGVVPKKEKVSYVDIPDEPRTKTEVASGSQRAKKFEEGYLRLGLSPESSRELATGLAYDYPETDTRQPMILDRLRAKQLSTMIKTLSEEEVLALGSIVTIGTAGSGKTSFLVKLALLLKACDRSSAFISLDSRKVVGQAELQAYARLIKVPFHRAVAESTVKTNLIDVQSLSVRSEEANESLAEKLAKSGAQAILVVDGSQRLNEIMRQFHSAQKFATLAAVAFTKMDLISHRGIIYDVVKQTKLPLLSISAGESFKQVLRFLTPAEVAAYILRRGEL